MIKTHVHFWVEEGLDLVAEAQIYPSGAFAKHLYTTWSTKEWLLLHRLWVRARARRKKYGTMLLNRVIQHADGIRAGLILRVRPFDAKGLTVPKLISFYTQHGFSLVKGETGSEILLQRLARAPVMIRFPRQ